MHLRYNVETAAPARRKETEAPSTLEDDIKGLGYRKTRNPLPGIQQTFTHRTRFNDMEHRRNLTDVFRKHGMRSVTPSLLPAWKGGGRFFSLHQGNRGGHILWEDAPTKRKG